MKEQKSKTDEEETLLEVIVRDISIGLERLISEDCGVAKVLHDLSGVRRICPCLEPNLLKKIQEFFNEQKIGKGDSYEEVMRRS